MTEHLQINDVAPRIQYDCDGVQAAYIYPFAVFRTADLEVWQDGARVSSGFSVSGAGISSGGVVVFAVPPAQGSRLTLRRRVALERISDFQTDGIIRAKTLNDELDYQVAAVQQVADDLSRCLQRPFTSASTADLSLPEPAAGRVLKWRADGTGLANSEFDPDQAVATVTASVAQVVADAAAAAADKAIADAAATAAQQHRAVAEAAAANAEAVAHSIGNPLSKSENLSDVPDPAAARANLGLGNAALCDVGVAAGQVPLADAVMLRGRHSLWVPAAAMVKHAGSASLDDFNPGGNGYSLYKGWSLDAATLEGACFDLDMPKDWDNSRFDLEILWSVAGTQTGGVRWGVLVGKMSAGGAIPTGWVDSTNLAATAPANGIAHSMIRTMLPGAALSGIADSDTLHLAVVRMAADAADTLAVDAVLRGVKIRYVTSQGSDD